MTSHSQTYSEAGLEQSRLWPVGTVCITIAANIASSAILTYPACFPDSVVGVIPDPGRCSPEYLWLFLVTARADLDRYAPATAQKNINIGILGDVLVPIPPRDEQDEIVGRAAQLFAVADAVSDRLRTAEKQGTDLRATLLADAFSGRTRRAVPDAEH